MDMYQLSNSVIGLTAAFVMGGCIGIERQYRQRTAGLRTHILVTLGAAIFVNLAKSIDGYDGAVRVIAYVVSGIGFLGAGVIMRQDGGIQGLNTSATIWCSGAVGAAAGANMYTIAILATAFVLSINILLRPIVNIIDRKPINNQTEITHNINIITNIKDTKKVIQHMRDVLAVINIQMQDFSINAFGQDEVIIKAVLVVTSITQEEMNDILNELNNVAEVEYAFCSLM
ncbi:MgtC/SapB family protein [Klebsiella sp. BIGb0407]|uniref:MgtC/SapB family protein n=1 Tax=Klebsiella sp. BIGb0407 TaxID=2940603 RepID=UPI002169B1E1|nr:MgtC/SapB family protein [Klebsiella sp. BIGb0407]MCS3431967.1 putative Mg2+ transporter-C (MgtC) family protein [Klebsiella sp. BIGb0407]